MGKELCPHAEEPELVTVRPTCKKGHIEMRKVRWEMNCPGSVALPGVCLCDWHQVPLKREGGHVE